MGITRPTGEQLRFRSATTGDHILDTYMENSEKGSRTLPDLMDDLFDSSGVFRAANFEFRFDSTNDKIQFRAGNFANSNTGWTDITTFFDITGTFSASTTYNNFDLLTLTNKDVYIVHGLSSGTTFADEAAVIASANTEKLVDVSEARDWASKTDGQVVSTDYSSKAYAVGGTGVDTTTGSAKDWAIKTSSTVGNTSEYSAKYWATSTAVTTVSSGIANINTVAAAIANVNTTATNISNVNTVAGISADVTSVANIDSNVTTVAGISANTTTVAGIASNVTTVAGISANVTTVAGIASNVTTVANNNTDVSTVATNVADLQTVADEIDNNNLQTVANDIAAVITAADDLNESTSEIEVVANAITNVDLVGGSIANVNTVATNIANVNTTATNIANVNTVGGISANVTTVAGISANVTTAATNNANITTVAGISGNVTTVAGISANVTTVAGISADVTTAATNVTAFNNTYLGAQSSAPTQDPDGSALDLGDLYFDTTSNTMKVYAQSGWTAAGSSVNGTADRFNYTATAGQTTFTGADANGNSLAYDSGYADIYMNGVKLAPADYTATNGTSIVLASGAALNDTLEIIAYGTFTLSTHYTKTQSDARYVNVAGDTMTGNLSFGDNDKAIFGAGSDLNVWHNGSHSYVQDTGTGNLYLAGSNVIISNPTATETMAYFDDDGGASLWYDNSVKLATTSTGIQVTGNIANASGDLTLDVAGDIILDADDEGKIQLQDNGVSYGRLDNNGGTGFDIVSTISDGDVRIRGNDGGAIINALTIDMSDAGTAIFNQKVVANSSSSGDYVRMYGGSGTGKWDIYGNGANLRIGDNENAGSVQFDTNVGIGASSPTAMLDVQNNAGSLSSTLDDTAEFQRADGTYNPRLQIRHSTTGTDLHHTWSTGASNLTFSIANTERMRIDSSGNVLVGKTAIGIANVGGELRADGQITGTKDGGAPLALNRKTSDGDIALFQKNGSTVGSIGTVVGQPYFISGSRGIRIAGNNIRPTATAGANLDNVISLGDTGQRFKDLYLSGGVYLGGTGSANKLSDYEEGLHTYTLKGASSGSATIPIRNGYTKLAYTKIGRMVTITGKIETLGSHSATGALRLSLPFTAANLTDQAGVAGGSCFVYRTSQSIYDNPAILPSTADPYAIFYYNTTSGDVATINANNLDAQFEILVSFSYFTNA